MNNEPIFCDMTDAVDTPLERLEEYRVLFAKSHLRTERTAAGVRHTFRCTSGVLDQLRELTVREQSCCGFLDLAVTADEDEVHWDIGTKAGPMAEAVVEDFHRFPETLQNRRDADHLPLDAVRS